MGIVKRRKGTFERIREHKLYTLSGFFYRCKHNYEYFVLVISSPYSNSLLRYLKMGDSGGFKYYILEDIDYTCVYNKRQLLEYVKNQMNDIDQFKTFIENVTSYE